MPRPRPRRRPLPRPRALPLPAAAVALAAALAGCDPGFEKASIVLDLRVLGMRAEPPEVVLDVDLENPQPVDIPPVTITALLADPQAERRLEWSLTACPGSDDGRCDPEQPDLLVATGVAEDPDSAAALEPGAGVAGELVPDLELLRAALEADPMAALAGVPLQIVLRVAPEGGAETEAAYAFKRVTYAPREPPERVANQNPWLEELLVDDAAAVARGACGDPSLAPLPVAPDQEIRLTPVEPEGARETYVLPTYDGGVHELTENLAYAWYATAGSFSSGTTGGPDFAGSEPPLFTFWTAPSAEEAAALPGGLVRFWLVQRDDRGGASWSCFVASVTGAGP